MQSKILSAVAMAATVSAHATMYGVWVNGEDQGSGRDVYIRTPPSNSPVKDLSSADIACNVNGATAAPEFVSAAAGDTLSFEWQHDNRGDDIIDGSHKGPIITWIAAYDDTKDGTGAVWTKIAEDGYDGSEWAVDRIRANGGKQDFVLPESLAAGKYLVRQEIIAQHESDKSYAEDPNRGAQFYPSCVQVDVTGGGGAVPDQQFDFNTDYTYQDPGIVFNLYGSFDSYPIPGPDVWTGSGSTGGGSNTAAPTAPEPTSAPEPTTTVVPVPQPTATTLSTVVSDAPEPTAAPNPPPTSCKAKRHAKKSKRSNKARRSSSKSGSRRVGRPQL
ncbi:hypothetical protein N3K66_006504 [Trichothecium roseum]|uniref:Uncharacterized protein n=1 Tax=Trichothecium roseum TaxID=47278 RepID=A0ACC0UVM7_9HYPO|nr:hypothetical protein N3K66_006504 [Trichothecium roseum]